MSVGLAMFATLVGCARSHDAPTGHSESALLVDCLTGVWLHDERPCSLTCPPGSPLETPECSAKDCVESGFSYLRADGTSTDGVLRRSATLRTFSALGGGRGLQTASWSVADGKLTQAFATRTWTTEVSCSGATLARPKIAVYKPAPAGLAVAIAGASKGSSWSGVAYVP